MRLTQRLTAREGDGGLQLRGMVLLKLKNEALLHLVSSAKTILDEAYAAKARVHLSVWHSLYEPLHIQRRCKPLPVNRKQCGLTLQVEKRGGGWRFSNMAS